jgi:hypothetical protein
MNAQQISQTINDAINDPSDDNMREAEQAVKISKNANDLYSFPIGGVYEYAAEMGNLEIIQWLEYAWNDLYTKALNELKEDEEICDHTLQGKDERM